MHWSQLELASRSGVSRNTIGSLLSGRHEPRAQIVDRISAAFGITVEELRAPLSWKRLAALSPRNMQVEDARSIARRVSENLMRTAAMRDPQSILNGGRLFNSQDIAKALGISVRTLDRMRERGEMAWMRIAGQVRFRPEDVEQYLKAARKAPQDGAAVAALGVSLDRVAAYKDAQRHVEAAKRGRDAAQRLRLAEQTRRKRQGADKV